jgi:hypothetical protein
VNLLHACERPHFESRFFSAEEIRDRLCRVARWVARQSPVKKVGEANPIISPELDVAFAAIMKIARPCTLCRDARGSDGGIPQALRRE